MRLPAMSRRVCTNVVTAIVSLALLLTLAGACGSDAPNTTAASAAKAKIAAGVVAKAPAKAAKAEAKAAAKAKAERETRAKAAVKKAKAAAKKAKPEKAAAKKAASEKAAAERAAAKRRAAELEVTENTFDNCTDMNDTYSHGVGLPGAHDRSSGPSVTTFKRSRTIYELNSSSDRDGDGVACEKL
jgi:membrane protein involved in colicin uptake